MNQHDRNFIKSEDIRKAEIKITNQEENNMSISIDSDLEHKIKIRASIFHKLIDLNIKR